MIKIQCAENGNDISYRPVHAVESRLFESPRDKRIRLENWLV